ncbi:MAG: hypothetical protein LBF15_05380 [Candidatus Peribacteria bacterium]|jgi:hypothetical protein|nr:hypothetical protein [Candidatus Peribacteria bacterium]
MKRVTEFLLSLLSLFFSGDWKDKAKEYGVSQEDINNFKPNPNIDFSVLEK